MFRDNRHFELTTRGDKTVQEWRGISHSAARISLLECVPEEERGQVPYEIMFDLISLFLDEVLRLNHQRHPSVLFQSEVQNS